MTSVLSGSVLPDIVSMLLLPLDFVPNITAVVVPTKAATDPPSSTQNQAFECSGLVDSRLPTEELLIVAGARSAMV